MNSWIFFIIVYILFMALGPIIKQLKGQQQQQRPTSSPSSKRRPANQNVQAKFEQYFGKIEQALNRQQSPPPLPDQASKLLSLSPQIPVHHEDVLESTPNHVETATHRLLDESSSELEFRLHPASLLAFDRRRGYIQGIILSEILGPPVSKRRKRRGTPS